MKYDVEYWNDKYAKKPIIYSCRTMKNGTSLIEIDVKNFISSNDEVLKKYIDKYGLKRETYNETAHACQKFIVDNFKYSADDVNSNISEYWQFPYETLVNGQTTGVDCEDGAILMASLMITCGIPTYRVRVTCGYVKPSETAPTCGHAYCTYLADRKEDSQDWIILDWCYFEDTELICEDKPLLREGGYNSSYGEIWFSFNNEYSWSNQEVTITANKIKDHEIVDK